MATFLYLDNTWINLDRVSVISVVPDNGGEPMCRIFFVGDPARRELHGAEAKKLLDYLREHKAQ